MRSFPTFFIGNPSWGFFQKPLLVGETRRTWLPNYIGHEIFGDAGVRPGSRATFVSAKVAKTIDAQFGIIGGTDAGWGADQLATLKQGPPVDKSVRPEGRTAGVGYCGVGRVRGRRAKVNRRLREPQKIPSNTSLKSGDIYANLTSDPKFKQTQD